jgi:hypothetical protein
MGVSSDQGLGMRRIATILALAFAASGFSRTVLAQDTQLIVVTGVSGDEDHAKQFHSWAATLIDAAKTKDGVPDANITYLAEKTDVDPRVKGRSTREAVEKTIADLAPKVKPEDHVIVVLIGHGSFDGKIAAFNLPGPDLTATEWAALLDKLSAAHVTFVDTTSSSGAFLPAMTGHGRTVVTATKTGGERNEPRFGEFFTAAFGDPSADADRNGHVSILEAFNYARNKVLAAYQQGGLIQTEHATLEDGSDGRQAATVFLTPHPADGGLVVDRSDPALKALADEREAIQKQIDALKLQKESIEPARYDKEMERLLTELAVKTKAIRDLQAQKDKK